MRDFVPDDFLPEPDALRDEREGGAAPTDRSDARIPDDLVDAFFDGEMDDSAARAFVRDLRGDPETAREVVSTNSALEAMRRPVSTPDFTGAVLGRVHRRTPLLSARQFSLLTHWRSAAAAAILLLVSGAFLAQRYSAGASSFTERPAPVSNLAESLPEATSGLASTVNVSLDTAERMVTSPPAGADGHGAGPGGFEALRRMMLSSSSACDAEPARKGIACEGTRGSGSSGHCGTGRRRGSESAGAPTGILGVVRAQDVADTDAGTIIIK